MTTRILQNSRLSRTVHTSRLCLHVKCIHVSHIPCRMVRKSLYRALWCTRILTVTQDKDRNNVHLATVMSGLRSSGNVHIFIGCGAVLLLLCLPCIIRILPVLPVKIQYKQKVGSDNSKKAYCKQMPKSVCRGQESICFGDNSDNEGRTVGTGTAAAPCSDHHQKHWERVRGCHF